jgi:hypothetical protein
MKHRFGTGKSTAATQQQAFIIETDELNESTLKALPEYLINHVHLLFEAEKSAKEDTMWPVMVDINGQLNISEEVLWTMVCDTLPNAKTLVLEYIQKLCRLAKDTEYGFLLCNDSRHFIGSYALLPFLTRYLLEAESRTTPALPVYDCFIKFIRCCDLEFETFQDEYIEKVLRKLIFVDEIKSVELLCIRLCNGQLTDKDFRYLYHFLNPLGQRPSKLKLVIDYLTDSNNLETVDDVQDEESIYLRLCAAIYGHNLKETKEVIDYVRHKRGDKLRPCCTYELNEVQRIRSECDAFRALQPERDGYFNSSFHLYDQKNKQWLPLK